MSAVIWFIAILTIISVITTIIYISKGDPNYQNSTKRNTMNLTVIYIVATIISLIALAIYIWVF